jgi:hypothetical protein
MESLVGSYFAEYQGKKVVLPTKALVKAMAFNFYLKAMLTNRYVEPNFERFIYKNTKTGYVRLTYSKGSAVKSGASLKDFMKYEMNGNSDCITADVIDLLQRTFQKWFLEELKSLVDQEEGVTLVAEESVVQSPYDNSDDENYTIQLTLDVDLPNLEVEKEPEGEEQDGEETVE